MPELVPPTTSVHASFLKAMAEFQAEGRGGSDDDSMIGSETRRYGGQWHEPAVFASYTAQLRAQSLESAPRPTGHVPCTTLWWVDDDQYLGRLAIRHRLTDWLLNYGGHIGYDVRPTGRRRGHATAMLRAALPVAHDLGIESALITCDGDNVASRKVIEACGGRFDDELRYWVPTTTLT
jgi:predicted acetyltransferase